MDHPDDNSPPTFNQTKGRRGPASSSCAECKRLKIRCTGTTESFPCASCVKRGVSAICPNGVMNGRTKREAGDSDVLRRRNQALATRVKELEIELAKAKGSAVSPAASGSDRRTDDEETVYNKDPDESSLVEAFGTLTIEAGTGRTTWHGPYTPTINLLPTDDPGGVDVPPDHLCDESLPPELAILASAFPFAKAAGIAGLRDAMRALAPSYNDAVRLAESFFAYASWLGSPCNKERFMVEVLMPLYASKSWELEQPDQLALFFGIESVGAMFDQNRPHYDPLAFRLHKLCAVSLALSKPLDKPTLTSLEAMQSHLFFHQLSDTPLAIARFWSLAGVAFRMAQALGLHRDSREWNLDPALEQRRRLLFWQLNFMDGVISAAYGRPRFFSPRHYDCPFPDEAFRPDLKGLITWRFRFLRDAFIPVLEDAFSVHPTPTYATIMRLDTRIRDLPLLDPAALGLDVMTMTSGELMQLFCVGGMKELLYLYLHRRFLFEAVSDEKCTDLNTHKYAYSFNAGLKAAVAMTRQTRGLYWKDPAMSSRLFFIWLHGFSAFAIFAAVVIKRPGCEQAEAAMNEMDSLLAVFNEAQSSRRVRRCLPTMLSLREKAFAVLSLQRVGQTFKVPLDDQLERLIGGSPVVLKVSQKGGVPLPKVSLPPQTQQSKLQFDLQALFGSEDESMADINAMFAQPAFSAQAAGAQASQWNDPISAPNTEGMSDIEQTLYGYFNDQSGILNLDVPNWETLI